MAGRRSDMGYEAWDMWTLNLSCDFCADLSGAEDLNGETRKEVFQKARDAGWTINGAKETCKCLECKSKEGS